jgi:hypothetical protein
MNVREYRGGNQKGQSRETGNIGYQDNIEAVNRRRTDSAMAGKKRTKGQTMICKTLLKIERYEHH